MAPSILGLGIPASSKLIPDHMGDDAGKMLKAMEAEMNATPYDWEFFDVEPGMDFKKLAEKLREKKWDVILIGSKFIDPKDSIIQGG